MNVIFSFLENKIMPVAAKMGNQRHLRAIRDGIMLAMPFIIIGSLFLILAEFPLDAYQDFMASVFGDEWSEKLSYPVSATFDILGLIASFGIAYRLAEGYGGLDALTAGAISLSSFLLATPFVVDFSPDGSDKTFAVEEAIPASLMGSEGLFVAIVLALVTTEIFRYLTNKNWTIKMPDGVPPSVGKSFSALIPGFVIITLVWLVRLGLEHTSFENLHNVIQDLLYTPLSAVGGSLGGTIIAVLLMTILWFAGIHGDSIVGSVMEPIWLARMDENRQAFEAGDELPNIITQPFIANFVHIGGTGATLTLVIAVLFFAKSKQSKELGTLAAPPSVFNINEPVIFGMPIVMNPMLIIPFFLVPVVITLTTYLAMDVGLVSKTIGILLPWTTPPVLSGYLATGDISGSLLQIFNIMLGFLIYLPFMISWDRQKVKEEKEAEQ